MQDALKNAESVVLSILISDGPRIIANKYAAAPRHNLDMNIGKNIKGYLTEYRTECLLFGGQISRSFRFMEEAVKKELSDIEGLDIRTVSDFSNAELKGLVEMLKAN